jgi:putative SOS response-associated peptidase YedK
MCGRYTNEMEFSQLKLAFEAADETFRSWTPTYNISPGWGPGHEQPFIKLNTAGHRVLRLGRFWFIPPWWSKALKQLPTLFNARAEELQEKRTWRSAFSQHRCLVPATGWREFVGDKAPKQPYHFSLSGEGFAFAGLSSKWSSPEGEIVESFSIVTTAPSEQAASYHDRMPLIMPKELFESWLSPTVSGRPALEQAMKAALSQPLTIFPTDPIGNNPRFEGKEAVLPLRLAADAAVPRPEAEGESGPSQLALPLGPPGGPKRS